MANEITEVICRYSREDWGILYVNPLVRILRTTIDGTHDMSDVCFSVKSTGSIEDVYAAPFIEFLKKPIEDMPLYVNDDFLWKRVLCMWRLKVAK